MRLSVSMIDAAPSWEILGTLLDEARGGR